MRDARRQRAGALRLFRDVCDKEKARRGSDATNSSAAHATVCIFDEACSDGVDTACPVIRARL
jgi:hypothetical protein